MQCPCGFGWTSSSLPQMSTVVIELLKARTLSGAPIGYWSYFQGVLLGPVEMDVQFSNIWRTVTGNRDGDWPSVTGIFHFLVLSAPSWSWCHIAGLVYATRTSKNSTTEETDSTVLHPKPAGNLQLSRSHDVFTFIYTVKLFHNLYVS